MKLLDTLAGVYQRIHALQNIKTHASIQTVPLFWKDYFIDHPFPYRKKNASIELRQNDTMQMCLILISHKHVLPKTKLY